MAYTIALFGSKPYDEASFNEKTRNMVLSSATIKGILTSTTLF